MRGLLPASLLGALLLAPLAAAVEPPPFCIIRYTPAADFQTLRVVQDLELNASELSALAAEVDADRDGNIAAAEVGAAEQRSVAVLNFSQLGPKKLTVDGRGSSARIQRELTGFEGPAAGVEARGKVQEVRDHTFEALESGDFRLLEGGIEASTYRVVVETVVFEAPAGWQLWSVNGSEVFRGNRSVQLSSFDTEGRFHVAFAREGYDPNRRDFLDVPGTPLALLVVAAALTALVARRRA